MIRARLRQLHTFTSGSEILYLSFLALIILELLVQKPLSRFPAYVDWNTIGTLSGLLLITTAIKESNFFSYLACRLSKGFRDERKLALFLIFTSAFLSMFLTNDIALFIIVPLTLSLQKISGTDYVKFIVFEALAVNVGSALTPIGNPQNIFLWHQWDISFLAFIKAMAPMVGIQAFFLLLLSMLVFPAKKIASGSNKREKVNRTHFGIALFLFILFLISLELHYDLFFLPLLFLIFLWHRPQVIKDADWKLIVLFIVIFIDVHLLYRLSIVNHFMQTLQLQSQNRLFVSGIMLSQIISNVPATLFLAKYSHAFKTIAYAVNVGGNGLFLASFANIIALHFTANGNKYRYFHRYSLLYLILTATSIFFLLPWL